MNINIESIKKTLGPGILFASTCVGVSHLVQSTRAGANYGFALIGAVLLANIFKYPFFEFASRYTNATGRSILDGYYHKSKWILIGYVTLTILSMFIVSAAVTFVTAGLLRNLFNIGLGTSIWAAIILSICIVLLIIGKYNALDSILKLVGAILVISTVIASISAILHGRPEPISNFIPQELYSPSGLIFIIALMGWMPTAVDMSAWTSLWTEARIKQTGYHPKLNETLFDFNLGYIVSAFLALCFLTLGSLIIYGTGTELSNSSHAFANQLISMFTIAIGDWSYYIIAIAALTTMFSTCITVIDGYSRTLARSLKLLTHHEKDDSRTIYIVASIILAIGTYLVITQYLNNLKQLVDFATILSFVLAPVAGFINYRVIYSKEFPPAFLPPQWLKSLAIAGLLFLIGFTGIYFVVLFNPSF